MACKLSPITEESHSRSSSQELKQKPRRKAVLLAMVQPPFPRTLCCGIASLIIGCPKKLSPTGNLIDNSSLEIPSFQMTRVYVKLTKTSQNSIISSSVTLCCIAFETESLAKLEARCLGVVWLEFPCLCLPALEVQPQAAMPGFLCEFWGFKLRLSCLKSKCFIHGGIRPSIRPSHKSKDTSKGTLSKIHVTASASSLELQYLESYSRKICFGDESSLGIVKTKRWSPGQSQVLAEKTFHHTRAAEPH